MTETSPMNSVEQRGERGFALLIVFLMAAAVALMLYRQIPRVAFESQRDKEELLIGRGEQYKRGIQLYFIAFKKYPAKIEDLENTNNQRFLRRRYIDPMTGKDEWRLIHVNGAGQLTDSLVQKPPAPADEKNQQAGNAPGSNPGTPNPVNANPGAPNPATGANPPNGTNNPPEVNAAVLRRPSDRPLVPALAAGLGASAPVVDPNDPRTWPPIFLQPAGQPGTPANPGQPGAITQGFPQFPGQQFPGQQFPGQQFPGQQFPGQQLPGQQYPGQPNPGQQSQIQPFPGQAFPGQQFPGQQYPGQVVSGQPDPNQFPGQPVGIQPGVPGVPPVITGQPGSPGAAIVGQPGFNPQNPNPTPGDFVIPPQNQTTAGISPQPGTFPVVPSGAGAINPNTPGGVPNPALNMINELLRTPRQPPNAPAAATNPLNAGGLAGVASTFAGPSIKVYKDRSKYNEWEFIFDLKQGLPGQPAQTQAPPNQNPAASGPGGNNIFQPLSPLSPPQPVPNQR